ncbi:MAG: adenylosuccinate lyase [Gammaproteobacteria bacterium]|nr:adenylosuccinate lyase [Gammaproteobacteria bacterium]
MADNATNNTLPYLLAISPVDGRYHNKCDSLRTFFSELALIKYRLQVEVSWLQMLAQTAEITAVKPLSTTAQQWLQALVDNFSIEAAQAVKNLEATTNHDVKAVEYFLRKQMAAEPELATLSSFIHFACTSEDINNLAYGKMVDHGRQHLLEQMENVIVALGNLAIEEADTAMLARTHGQPATPTTFGKEIAVFVSRLRRQRDNFAQVAIQGKFNGASGNYNAHAITWPDINWEQLSQQFVEQLGLNWSRYTTQIEPHDYLAELLHAQIRFNNILLDLCRDLWNYISRDHIKQRAVANEVGSSTMPHKVNPIDFENAEGNLGIANATMAHLADKLAISRMQRDLSDSTALRNLGNGFAHVVIAYQALMKGLSKLEINRDHFAEELANHYEVLTEAVQTVMRAHGISDAYEALKSLSRGKRIDAEALRQFIDQLAIPQADKVRLQALTPANYLGLAPTLARSIHE